MCWTLALIGSSHIRGPPRCEMGGGRPFSDEAGEGPQKLAIRQDKAHLLRLAVKFKAFTERKLHMAHVQNVVLVKVLVMVMVSFSYTQNKSVPE